MSARGPELDHALCNQIAIVLGYCELLLDELPQDSAVRSDVAEMHKAALAAMDMLRSEDRE
ncbi:MAG TPA: hypothetical protein VF921_02365 [Vicinamibacterales bacterium]